MQTFPARGNTAVEILLNDHQTIKRLLGELTEAHGAERRKSTLEMLKGLLTVHNATEENLVYPAIAFAASDKRESKHLYEETASADMLLFQLDTMLKKHQDDDFEAMANEFREAVLHHIDEEESKAFPRLEERAERDDEQLLTQSVREFRESFTFQGDNDQS